MSILVIKNITHEGPGRLEESLHRHGIPADIVDLSAGDILPDLIRYKALVVLGGPMSANDNTLHMNIIRDYVQAALESSKAFLGICLGMQILASVAGAEILTAREKEIGWFNHMGEPFQLVPTEAGKADPLFSGAQFPAVMFHLHGETVSECAGVRLLAFDRGCRHQIIKVGPAAYGIQGHIEITEPMLIEWWRKDPDLYGMNRDRLVSDYRRSQMQYEKFGETLVLNFLTIAGYGT